MFTASGQPMEDEIFNQSSAFNNEVLGVQRAVTHQCQRAIGERVIDSIYGELFLQSNSKFSACLRKQLATRPPTTQTTINFARQELHAVFDPLLEKCASEVDKAVGMALHSLQSYVTGIVLPRVAEAHSTLMNVEMRTMFEQLRLRVDFVAAAETVAQNGTVKVERKEVIEREAKLHSTVDKLQQEAASRITEKQEAVEEVRRRMTVAHEEGTVDLQRVVAELTAESSALKRELSEVKEERLHLTQLAHCFDELCGKLNKQALALRAFIVERGEVTKELMAMEEALARCNTSLSCRGTPLTVGGGWVVGDAPDTIGKLNLLCGTNIPTAACSFEQHRLLDGIINAVELRQDNTKLKQRVAFLEKQLDMAEVAGFKMRLECEQEKRRSAQQSSDHLRKLLDENAALRTIAAASVSAAQAQPGPAVTARSSASFVLQPSETLRVKQLELEVFDLKRKLEANPTEASSTAHVRQPSAPQMVSQLSADPYQPQLKAAMAAFARRSPRGGPPSARRPSTAAAQK